MRLVGAAMLALVSPVLASLALASPGATAGDLSTPVGLWQAIDSSGHAEGLIRFYEDHGAFFGRIEPTKSDHGAPRRCTRCSDERRDRPFDGLVIIRNLRLDGDEYTGGDVLDPESGRLYGCKLKLIDGGHKMVMRGFFGISLLGRSQTWQRVESASQ